MTLFVTPWEMIPTITLNEILYTEVLCQSFHLLLLVIQHRRSRFDDYTGRLGKTIFRQIRVLWYTYHG